MFNGLSTFSLPVNGNFVPEKKKKKNFESFLHILLKFEIIWSSY